MTARYGKRSPGTGRVYKGESISQPWHAWAPGTKSAPGEFLGRHDTRHAAERALNAWWTIQALAALGVRTCAALSA